MFERNEHFFKEIPLTTTNVFLKKVLFFQYTSKVFCHIALNHVLITFNMRFVFSFVVPSRSLNPPMVECYVTIESCLRHIRVSTQGTNECVHCIVMLFLVSHQFNYSPHIFPANLAFLSRGFDHPLFYFSPVTSVMFYPPFTYLY